MKAYFLSLIISLPPLLYSSSTAVVEIEFFSDEDVVVKAAAPPSRLDIDESQMMCLSLAVYFEARNQSLLGQAAVAKVVLNRAEDPFWPNNLCDVVKQGAYLSGKVERNRCQFSFYCDGLSDRPTNITAWNNIQEHVYHTLRAWEVGYDVTFGATNYHTKKVNPDWRNDRGMDYVVTIGDHIFYQWNRTKTVAFD